MYNSLVQLGTQSNNRIVYVIDTQINYSREVKSQEKIAKVFSSRRHGRHSLPLLRAGVSNFYQRRGHSVDSR